MTATGSAGLWAIATVGSLAVHGLVGYTLFAMPLPEPRQDATTEIRFESPEDGTATSPATATQTEAASPSHGLVRASAPAASTLPAVSAAAPVIPTASAGETLAPTAPRALDAVSPTLLPEAAPGATAAGVEGLAEPIAPSKPGTVEASEVARSQSVAVAVSETAMAEDRRETTAITPSDAAAIAVTANHAPEATASVAVPDLQPAARAAEQLAALEGTPIVQPAPAGQVLPPAVLESGSLNAPEGSPLPANPADASAGSVAVSIRPVEAAPVAIGSAAAPATTSSTIAAAPVATGPDLPSDGPVAAAPPRDTEPADPAAARPPVSVAAAVPAVPAPQAADVVAPSSAPIAVEPVGPQVALLPVPQIEGSGGGQGSDTETDRLMRDFLRSRKGDKCLLAVPAEDGEVAVEAFAVSNAAVADMAADFERQARSKLATTVRSVVPGQCSALGFARGLPQYPNYLLHVIVARPEIRSGEKLEGFISGVTKDTLYLVAVDDEGKAKLVESHSGLEADTHRFSEPVHLTTDPVASVQLLVAIASDGPLKSMPNRDGLPADLFFSGLTMEIINDNRSIAFGMSSFILR